MDKKARAEYMRNYRAVKKEKLFNKTPLGILKKFEKENNSKMDVPVIWPLKKRAIIKKLL
jgi:hypothetical protein